MLHTLSLSRSLLLHNVCNILINILLTHSLLFTRCDTHRRSPSEHHHPRAPQKISFGSRKLWIGVIKPNDVVCWYGIPITGDAGDHQLSAIAAWCGHNCVGVLYCNCFHLCARVWKIWCYIIIYAMYIVYVYIYICILFHAMNTRTDMICRGIFVDIFSIICKQMCFFLLFFVSCVCLFGSVICHMKPAVIRARAAIINVSNINVVSINLQT